MSEVYFVSEVASLTLAVKFALTAQGVVIFYNCGEAHFVSEVYFVSEVASLRSQ